MAPESHNCKKFGGPLMIGQPLLITRVPRPLFLPSYISICQQKHNNKKGCESAYLFSLRLLLGLFPAKDSKMEFSDFFGECFLFEERLGSQEVLPKAGCPDTADNEWRLFVPGLAENCGAKK